MSFSKLGEGNQTEILLDTSTTLAMEGIQDDDMAVTDITLTESEMLTDTANKMGVSGFESLLLLSITATKEWMLRVES